MAEHKKNIDDYFHKRIGNFEMPISDEDWTAIEAKLPPAKKKKKGWLWLALLPLTAVVIWFASHIMVEPKKLAQDKAPMEETVANKPKIDSPTEESGHLTPEKKIETEMVRSPNKQLPNASEGLKSESKEERGPESKEITEDNEEAKPSDLTQTKGVEMNESEEKNDQIEESAGAENQDSSEKKDTIEPQEADRIENTEKPGITPLPKASFGLQKNWFLYAAFGPGGSSWEASQNNVAPQFSELQSTLQSLTRPFIRIGVGKNIGQWSISTDFDFTSIGSNASYNFNKQIFDSIPVLDPNGNIIGYFFNNFRDTAINYNTVGKISTSSINLMLERRFSLGPKSSLLVNLSGGYSMNLSANGNAMNPQSLYKMPLSKEILNNGNAQAGAGIRYAYSLFSDAEIFGGFMLRRRFGNLYKDMEGFRITQYQFEFGLRYNMK